jgi:hypothetical protein
MVSSFCATGLKTNSQSREVCVGAKRLIVISARDAVATRLVFTA